jgi:hypothetical protein
MTALTTITPLIPSEGEITRFFSQVLSDQIHLVAIHSESEAIVGKNFGVDVEQACAWAAEMNTNGWNIYYHVSRTRAGVDKKAYKADLVGIRFAHCDIDPPKDGSSWEPDEALASLKNAPVAPSVIVWSGNGWQALWPVADATMDRVEEVNCGLIAAFQGDKGTHNADRILRVPGTVNWPNEKKRALGRVATMARIEEITNA